MSESNVYGTPVTYWTTPPSPECACDSGQYSTSSSVSIKSTWSHSKPESVDFLGQQLKYCQLVDRDVKGKGDSLRSQKLNPFTGNERTALLHQSSQGQFNIPPSTLMSHHQVLNTRGLGGSQDVYQYSSSHDAMRPSDVRRPHEAAGSEVLGMRDHRSPSKPPPKAIVTPLMGVVHHRPHTSGSSHKNYPCNQSHLKKLSSDTVQVDSDVDGWKSLLEKKDNILIQKTDLIERQKQAIASLQTQLKEKDTYLTAMSGLSGKNISSSSTRLKELEYENASLKAQLTAVTKEFHQLSTKCSTVDTESSRALDHDKRAQEKLSSIQSADNSAECHVLKQQVDDISRKYKRLTETHHTKDREVHRLKAELSDSALTVKQLKEQCQCLDEKLTTVQTEREKLIVEYQKVQRLLFEGEASNRRDLQAMRERHKQRFVEATAQLRSRHKAMAKRVRALEMQLSRNSDVISALNDEVQMSHGTIGDMKLSMKDLLSQNQHLVEQNLSLQEHKDHASKSSSDITDTKVQQLTSELVHCVEDFESLVALCSSLLQGCDPSASLIFGVEDYKSEATAAASDLELTIDCSVGDKLTQVKRLKTKIDQLREVVSEQFASQVSNTCHVQ